MNLALSVDQYTTDYQYAMGANDTELFQKVNKINQESYCDLGLWQST